jgi:hypothetical protein
MARDDAVLRRKSDEALHDLLACAEYEQVRPHLRAGQDLDSRQVGAARADLLGSDGIDSTRRRLSAVEASRSRRVIIVRIRPGATPSPS